MSWMFIPPLRFDSDPMRMVSMAERSQWGVPQLKVPQEWINSEGEGVTVFICDTGAPRHKDLPDAIGEFDFTNSQVTDNNGHHTHCTGIVGARRNDDGVVGFAPRCRFGHCKVLSDSGSGSSRGIAGGINKAIDEGADIISLSLGGGYDRDTEEACKRGDRERVLIFAAAGNSGYKGRNTVGYPGALDSTICVTSYREDGNISDFSSGGPTAEIAMPGEKILSTWLDNTYRAISGTSMATPGAVGIAALMLSIAGHRMTKDEFIKILIEHAEDRGEDGRDVRFGYGVPYVGDMLDKARDPDLDLDIFKYL